MSEENVYNQLVVRKEELENEQKKQLVRVVLPFAVIDPESRRVHMKSLYDDLNTKHKVLVYLLARLALSDLSNSTVSSAVSPKEIEKETGLPGGTVRPKLTQLVTERLITKDGDQYLVTSLTVVKACKDMESSLPD